MHNLADKAHYLDLTRNAAVEPLQTSKTRILEDVRTVVILKAFKDMNEAAPFPVRPIDSDYGSNKEITG